LGTVPKRVAIKDSRLFVSVLLKNYAIVLFFYIIRVEVGARIIVR